MEENIIGLMWHDSDSKKSLAEKMIPATASYKRNFGGNPTSVELHPDDYPDIPDESVVNGLVVSRSHKTPPSHYFLRGELIGAPFGFTH